MPENTEQFYGFLVVFVTTGRGSLPVENARVRIYRGGEASSDTLLYELTTDIDGKTDAVALAAPAAYLSQSPGNQNSYALYTVEVSAEGFYTELSTNLPIFSGITAVLPCDLVPESAFRPEENIPRIGRS